MSAPTIPNLLSLRGRGGGRGRGFGRGRGGHGLGSSSTPGHAHDVTIQGTDTDAALSRMSAVELGYLGDPFAELFVQNTAPGPQTRRLPIINRGTYTRTTAIDTLVNHFLESTAGSPRQIVSLGAGTDTRALRLFASTSPAHSSILYHEIDFPAITAKKLATVRAAPRLRSLLTVDHPTASSPSTTWTAHSSLDPSKKLFCHGIDLRDLASPKPARSSPSPLQPQQPPPSFSTPPPPPSVFQPPPSQQQPSPPSSSSPSPSPLPIPHLLPNLPTLLLSECCLCYLPTPLTSSLLRQFTSSLPNLSLILYEPIRPSDPFGRMMVTNLAARGIVMPTLEAYKEPENQERRLRDVGFEKVETMTVDRIWERWVSQEEKERVDGLEGLDEVEEWELLAGHYIVVWGWKGEGFDFPTGGR